MADALIIQDVAVACRIGVSEEERAEPQTIWIDLELAIDAAAAAARDDVRSTIDYARLVGAITQLVQAASYHLLETVAEEVASLVLKEFDTPWVRVRVRKKALPGIEFAAVEIEREGQKRR